LDGNHVFALSSCIASFHLPSPGWGAPALLSSSCIASFHLPSPRMGSARVAFVLSSVEERNFAEVGTFQPSFDFKDFHQAARLHLLAGGCPRR
jgi:hypothetical protein